MVRIEDLLESKFRQYYRKTLHRILPPREIEKREFGFAYFREKMMIRHRRFISVNELKKFVEDSAPSDVYHSTAYYSRPEEEMDAKGWLKADLVFDIDADHIPSVCRKDHDPDWICEHCLREAKNETSKLVRILIEDRGLAEKDLRLLFTGHRGYHVHVISDVVATLDSEERKDYANYILGTAPEVHAMGLLHFDDERPKLPEDLSTKNWRTRIVQKLFEIATKGDLDELSSIGLKDVVIRVIVERRKTEFGYQDFREMIEGLETRDEEGRIILNWEKVFKKIIEKCSARIDSVVTTDVHRLIRVGETLNGKTGLRSVEIGINQLNDFDPFEDAIGIESGEETIYAERVPKFRLAGSIYGPFHNQEVTLPTAAALLLLCKGRARPVIVNA